MSATMPLELSERVVLLLIVVDSWFNWLLMFVTPVDSEATLLFVVLRPVDSEPMPVDVDVDSELTLLFVELRPVDSELIAVEVDVDSDATLLFVVLRPVDSELMPVDSDEMFDAVDVDRLVIAWFVALSWLPLIASVLLAEIRPAATFVIWRVAPVVASPTLTTPTGELPAKKYVAPPIVALDVGFAALVTEFAPSAIELATLACAFVPKASASAAVALAPEP